MIKDVLYNIRKKQTNPSQTQKILEKQHIFNTQCVTCICFYVFSLPGLFFFVPFQQFWGPLTKNHCVFQDSGPARATLAAILKVNDEKP